MKRSVLVLAALACLAGKNRASTVTWWEAALPSTLHPLWAASTLDLRAQAPIYDTLVDGEPGAWTSALATQVRVETGKATLTLRRDVRWQDGERFTSADVCATVDALRAREPVTPLGARLGRRLQHCSPLPSDPWTVVIHLADTGDADPVTALHFPVLPAHLAPLTARDHSLASKPIGTGPWSATLDADGVRYLPHASPQNPTGLPPLALVVGPDSPTEAQLDKVRGWARLPASQVLPLRENPAWNLAPYALDTVIGLALDTTSPPLSDPLAREALDKALDRQRLCKELVGSWPRASPPPCKPTASPFAASSGATNHGIPVPDFEPLPAAPTLSLAFAIPAELEIDAQAFGDWLVSALAPHPVTFEILPTAEIFALSATERRTRWEAIVFQRFPADAELAPMLAIGGRNNWFDATDPEVIAALDARDEEGRYQLHAVIADQRPILPLVELSAMAAWSSDYTPVWMTPTDGLGNMERWGFSAAEPSPRRRR